MAKIASRGRGPAKKRQLCSDGKLESLDNGDTAILAVNLIQPRKVTVTLLLNYLLERKGFKSQLFHSFQQEKLVHFF